MSLTGKSLIAGEWTGEIEGGFTAFNATSGEALVQTYADASEADVNQAIISAQAAFQSYGPLPAGQRAKFLRTIGEQIVALGDELVDIATTETGLPAMRIQGERGRTVGQLNLFSDLLESGEYQGVIEHANPTREPLPKPDTRLGYLPLGVVGVFAASNFPLAFSTAGGDTASALAAGCPVVMKAHAAHPGTAELVARAILQAIDICQLPKGVFSLIQGKNYAIASQIVSHPLVKAVGFTGSERVGLILQQQINERSEPIPFYGELGSLNPQMLMANKVAQDGEELAQALVASLMMGQGQFCTSPGLWVVVEDDNYATFEAAAAKAISEQPAGVMLTPAMAKGYAATVQQWKTSGADLVAQGQAGDIAHHASAYLFATDLATFKNNELLREEVFGSTALIVRCKDTAEQQEFISYIKGQLTGAIHAIDSDLEAAGHVAQLLVHKVGRLIYNQMPTGVEVCASMNHGGPFPAATDIRSTSVGSNAIQRFQRPICYQNMPQVLLPTLLKDVK